MPHASVSDTRPRDTLGEVARSELIREQAARAEAEGERDRLRQALELKRQLERQRDEILAVASHDLKTPLATIKGLSQLLRRQALRAGTVDVTRVVDGLERIDLSVSRLSEMVDDLLDANRVQTDRQLDLTLHPTDDGRQAPDSSRSSIVDRLSSTSR